METKIPYLNTKISTDIIITALLAPLWWLTGMSIFVYHLVSLLLIFKLMLLSSANGIPIKIPKPALPLTLLIIFYGLSIIINSPFNDSSRTLASLYNLSFWVMGLLLIILTFNTFGENDLINFAKTLKALALIIGVIALVSLIFWHAKGQIIKLPTPLLSMFPSLNEVTLIKASATINILDVDWFGYSRLARLSIMSPYPNALAGLMLIILPFIYGISAGKTKANNLLNLFIFSLAGLVLLFSLSRIAIGGLIFALLFVFVLKSRNRIAIGALFVVILLFLVPILVKFFQYINQLRPGSTNARFDIYLYTIKTTIRNNLLLGIGVKPREVSLAIPVGSHCTYLGLFLRSGLMGLLSLLFFQAVVFFSWFKLWKYMLSKQQKRLWAITGIVFIAIAIWAIGEDLDVPQLVAFLYFIVVGITVSLRKFKI